MCGCFLKAELGGGAVDGYQKKYTRIVLGGNE